MITINEELIRNLSGNESTTNNGKKLENSFFDFKKSTDNTYYEAKCTGSGKNPYFIQIDIHNDTVSCKCSCPSRQFPCKHSVGLLFCIAKNKNFETTDVPANILQKWNKHEASKEKIATNEPKKVNKSALLKNLHQQLIGIDLAKKFTEEVLYFGLSSISSKQIAEWREMNKSLDIYAIPSIQNLINEILAGIEKAKEKNEGYETALNLITKLFALCKKAKEFLLAKTQSEDTCEYENSEIYSLLGYAWKLEQLEKLSLFKENVDLIQLAFFSANQEDIKSLVEYGFWQDLNDGKVYQTQNFIPYKASKHIAKQDSCFSKTTVPKLYIYPAERRVRWSNETFTDVASGEISKLLTFAEDDYDKIVKDVKNYFKAVLNDGLLAKLVRFEKLACIENGYAIEGKDGISFKLVNNFGHTPLKHFNLIDKKYFEAGNAILGTFDIDNNGEIVLTPLSVVTSNNILRLIG